MDTRVRNRVQVTDPMAPVRLSPVRVNGGPVTNKGIEIFNDDEAWECINIHTSSYSLIPNVEVANVTSEILDDSRIAWESTREVWTGRYWAKLYKSDVTVEAPQVGDTLSLGLRVENSYDGSCQFRLALMAFVLSCENGLVSPRHFTSFKMRHTTGNGFQVSDAISFLRSGMDELMGIVPLVEELSEIPLTIELLSRVSRETTLPSGEWGHITRELGGAHTAWDLMQAITHRLTHHGRGKSSLLYQEQVGDYFLDHLVNSAA